MDHLGKAWQKLVQNVLLKKSLLLRRNLVFVFKRNGDICPLRMIQKIKMYMGLNQGNGRCYTNGVTLAGPKKEYVANVTIIHVVFDGDDGAAVFYIQDFIIKNHTFFDKIVGAKCVVLRMADIRA